MRKINLYLKRFIDIYGSVIGSIIISPLLIIIAISIKLNSKGPVFFKQSRLGKNGKVFAVFKFRTMVEGAENIGDGLTIKNATDSRITQVGKVLRTSSLDELPQLFNVVLGDMSLVGPRPPVPHFPYNGYENYSEEAKKRFSMRPGITGLSQVTVRNSVSWDERIKLDNQYVEKFNLRLDSLILLKTVKKLFSSEDIYMKK